MTRYTNHIRVETEQTKKQTKNCCFIILANNIMLLSVFICLSLCLSRSLFTITSNGMKRFFCEFSFMWVGILVKGRTNYTFTITLVSLTFLLLPQARRLCYAIGF